eukprot:3653580-Amphidinium_carterae.1
MAHRKAVSAACRGTMFFTSETAEIMFGTKIEACIARELLQRFRAMAVRSGSIFTSGGALDVCQRQSSPMTA